MVYYRIDFETDISNLEDWFFIETNKPLPPPEDLILFISDKYPVVHVGEISITNVAEFDKPLPNSRIFRFI